MCERARPPFSHSLVSEEEFVVFSRRKVDQPTTSREEKKSAGSVKSQESRLMTTNE